MHNSEDSDSCLYERRFGDQVYFLPLCLYGLRLRCLLSPVCVIGLLHRNLILHLLLQPPESKLNPAKYSHTTF